MIVLVALLLLLPLLAVLQYRWLAQLSERESEHMKANLRAMATRFGEDFDDELTRVYVVMFPLPGLEKEDGLPAYVARYDQWVAIARRPRLIKDVLVAHVNEGGRTHLHQLKTDAKQFVPLDWPVELSALRSQLEEHSKTEGRASFRELMSRRFQPVNGETMALIYPILIPPGRGQRGQMSWPPPTGFVIITFSLSEIQQEMLPALAKRHFSAGANEFDYSAVIVTRDPEQKVIYRFGPNFSTKSNADVTVGLMGLSREGLRRILSSLFPADIASAPMRGQTPGAGTAPNAGQQQRPGDGFRIPPVSEGQKLWELRLTHRAGSLETAVTAVRRRNLLISFGILVLLAASVTLMIVSARRAQRLARQQMDFVAGVSHELRTPLAVIKSAAWNLARGVARSEEQIRSYSVMIGKESDRLVEMIEQVLEFAGAQSGRQKLELQPTSASELIDNTLASAQPLLAEGGFEIEKNVSPDLPQVMADASALSRALRNLIDNAMKYSGEKRWIGVQAQVAGSGANAEVEITISDRGMGIPASELKHVFEPFWRGSEATAAQIHGNGLGLNLVKNIVKAHSGRVSARSAPGRGSSFTLTLPAIAQTGPQAVIGAARLDTGVER